MANIGLIIPVQLRDEIFQAQDLERLAGLGDLRMVAADEKTSLPEAIEVLRDCDVAIGSWGTPNIGNEELATACQSIRLWEHVAGSTKMMFKDHIRDRDITIASCKSAIADCVAEMTLGEIILGVRGFFQDAADNQRGERNVARIRVMFGSTIGVIGASEVGKRVIRLLEPFGCEVLLYDPVASESLVQELGVERVADLVELCSRSDAVTLHTPALEATRHMLKGEHFQTMRDHVTFVNTSRESCIDQSALITELEKGRLFALLDVADSFPEDRAEALRNLANLRLTSHIAGPKSPNLGHQCVKDVEAFLSGGQPDAVITWDMLETTA